MLICYRKFKSIKIKYVNKLKYVDQWEENINVADDREGDINEWRACHRPIVELEDSIVRIPVLFQSNL